MFQFSPQWKMEMEICKFEKRKNVFLKFMTSRISILDFIVNFDRISDWTIKIYPLKFEDKNNSKTSLVHYWKPI